ncbi:hypothetical protein BGZ76_008642 [Entomortierella beljakovae]|nr:hypothetical protein BGZ76_008642 [Entomortierella beljakovae]
MSYSDTTPLLGGNTPRRTSIPSSRTNPNLSSSLGNNNTNYNGAGGNPKSTSPQRHWSEETEDISGPDPNSYGHQNTGAGYRRRGPPPPVHQPSSGGSGGGGSGLDAQRFYGQDRPTRLQQYSKTERYLMALAGFFFLLAVGFLCAFVRAREHIPASGKNGICTTRECTITAADILRDMRPEVDPCTDFFEFNCGGFIDRVSIPDDKARIGYFDLVMQQNREVIKSILSPESNNVQRLKDDASKRNLIKLQSLYESCMDEKKISEVGAQPLTDLVQKLIKAFPVEYSVLDQSSSSSPDYIQVLREVDSRKESMAKAGREELALVMNQLVWLGVSSVIEFDVDSDPKNPNMTAFMLGESGLGLPSKHYYEEDKIMNVYQKTVEEMFIIVLGGGNKDKDKDSEQGSKPPTPIWEEVAKNVVGFEKLLASISSEPEDLENSELTYNPRSLKQISELIPIIDWSLMLEKLLGSGTKVPNPIIVSMPDYLEKLNALLRDTPALTLQNYFVWKLIHGLSGHLALELRKPILDLKAELQGISADLVSPRWETCIGSVDQILGEMAGHYFIQKAFQGESKEMADNIIYSLRTAFVKGLPQLEWLDKETRLNATEKVDLMIQKIGYSIESPDIRSSEALEDHFKDLGIDKTDFFGNHIRYITWNTKHWVSQLGKPVDKAKWLMSPQTVNAYYNPNVNEIVFPAGILQPPFFHVNHPEYINYGGIGVVAGHELTHAFDNEGRLFDAHGKLTDWWSNSTAREFKERSQCYIDQYGNFTVKDPQGRENHVNGKLTLGENLADNGGLKKSFEAWQARFKSDVNGNKYKNHLLAGLEDYTREQLFYMSFARVWCSQRRPASAIESLRTDPHSPPKWRVNGAVQNSLHFAEVFNCKPRSAMNPDSKCDMW